MTLSSQDELERLHARSTERLARLLAEIQVAHLLRNAAEVDRLTAILGEATTEALAAADLLGRRRLILELRAAGALEVVEDREGAAFAATPAVPFLEAIADLAARIPGLGTTAQAVRDLWSRRGFAVARSAALSVTERIQDSVVGFLRQGIATSVDDAIRQVRSALTDQVGGPGGYTRAYAETVFRTTTSSAYQAGRQAQAEQPGIRRAACGWRFDATLDSDVRPNHRAGDDLVAHVEDPIWRTHAPPLGYQCRCATSLVLTRDMVRLGLSDAQGNPLGYADGRGWLARGFFPDPGFKPG